MHRAAFQWAGLPGEYDAVRVTPAELEGRIAALRGEPDVLGVNLSLPHKETVLPLLDDLTPEARRIGAVNTVIHRHGFLKGHNTDAPGLFMALQDAGMLSIQGRPVVVLGAGGAARAAVYTALISMERDVFVVNRTRAKAEELARAWFVPGAEFQVNAADSSDVPWADVGLIINSSSAGLNNPEETPLPDFNFRSCPNASVYDMVYKPAETRLMRDARAAGLNAQNGLGMLAHQARLAFQAWTNVDVPVQVFLDALHRQAGAKS